MNLGSTTPDEKRAYDNSRREQLALLRSAARALDDPPPEERERLPRRVRQYRKRRSKLPDDMRCPMCNEVTTASKSWVVGAAIKRGLKPQCKRCWARLIKQEEQSDA